MAETGRHPSSPDTPTPPEIVSHELRQQLVENPERVPCSGSFFVAGTSNC
jgi:hypothetical protein